MCTFEAGKIHIETGQSTFVREVGGVSERSLLSSITLLLLCLLFGLGGRIKVLLHNGFFTSWTGDALKSASISTRLFDSSINSGRFSWKSTP